MENKLQFERVWVQRSIALVLLFMFWNGYTDIFWSAPSLLFDPLLLVLWLFFIVRYRNELKNLRFVWVLGIAILLNNLLHISHFSDLINRSVLLQSENSFLVEPISGLLSNMLTSVGWGMFLWKLLLNNQYRNYWILVFILFSIPILFFWTPAMLFFNGLIVVLFILLAKERTPFHWFLIAQFITVCMAVFQMFAWFISFSPGGKG